MIEISTLLQSITVPSGFAASGVAPLRVTAPSSSSFVVVAVGTSRHRAVTPLPLPLPLPPLLPILPER